MNLEKSQEELAVKSSIKVRHAFAGFWKNGKLLSETNIALCGKVIKNQKMSVLSDKLVERGMCLLCLSLYRIESDFEVRSENEIL